MKKLMFALAAVAAGAVFADEGFTSQNIVGFQNNGNDVSGYFQRGASFVSCGSETDSADIQSIVPQVPADAVNELMDGEAQIQEIDDFGTPTISYFWLVEGSPDAKEGKAGWYTRDDNMVYTYADRTFVRGEGFLYIAPYFEDNEEEELPSSFQNSGEVKLDAKTVENPCSGYFHRANYRPIELSIQKISPVAPIEAVNELMDGEAQIQEIDDFGTPTISYFWLVEGSPDAKEGKAGWYTRDDNMVYTYADKVFAPGEGFLYIAPYFEDSEEEELASWAMFAE